MVEVNSWDDINRHLVVASDAAGAGLEVSIIEEDLKAAPAWSFKASHHSVFVHLEGQLASHEATFENGPATTAIPSVGGVWMVPAEQRFESLPRGRLTRFCEIRVSARRPDGASVEISPRIDIQDGFLHAAAQVFQRGLERDDLSRVSSHHLLEAVRWHIIERYDLNQGNHAGDSKLLDGRTKQCITSYIDDMINRRITLEDLAQVAALDIHTLLKRFFASFGTTPTQYIANVRIERAKSLLASSSLPVGDIAALAGFDNPSHFCVTFVRHVGIAPTAFRQARR